MTHARCKARRRLYGVRAALYELFWWLRTLNWREAGGILLAVLGFYLFAMFLALV